MNGPSSLPFFGLVSLDDSRPGLHKCRSMGLLYCHPLSACICLQADVEHMVNISLYGSLVLQWIKIKVYKDYRFIVIVKSILSSSPLHLPPSNLHVPKLTKSVFCVFTKK